MSEFCITVAKTVVNYVASRLIKPHGLLTLFVSLNKCRYRTDLIEC